MSPEIETLYQICLSASNSSHPPFKALFVEYDAFVEDEGIDPAHEAVLFRWICEVGDSTKKHIAAGERVDLIHILRTILAAQGVETVLDDEDEQDDTRSLRVSNTPPKKQQESRPRRRVSFGDAHVEETWLSEHSDFAHPQPAPAQRTVLKQPPGWGRDVVTTQRARSTSSSRPFQSRHHAPKHYQEGSPSSYHGSELEEQQPTLRFDVSQTQLEQNAEAFRDTTELRTARRYLHIWHDQALALQSSRAQSRLFAGNHDRRKLLKESLDTLIATCAERKQKREQILQAEQLERQAQAREQQRLVRLDAILAERLDKLRRDILHDAFTHWYKELRYQIGIQEDAKRKILKLRYFYRWRRLTLDNAAKARTIISRKYLRKWRENTARSQLVDKQAEAHFEESLAKRCLKAWFWNFCSKRVETWRQQRLLRGSFDAWVARLQGRWTEEDQAAVFHEARVGNAVLKSLRQRKDELQQASQTAESLYRRTLTIRCFALMKVKAKLAPREKTVSVKIELDLKRKALKIWQMHLSLTRQAYEVDRKRILQAAWTSWNDGLRCRALGQRIDERILVENLYRWVLQARLKAHKRAKEQRLLAKAMRTWHQQLHDMRAVLEQAMTSFESSQRWRILRFGMVRLNIALRTREDAERAAIEFSNSRAMPNVLDVWKQRTEHARMLAKWAADARFYCLTTRTLALWRERTEEHKHRRRREAYTQIRTRVKLRMVRRCFNSLRVRTDQVRSMREDAERSAQARAFNIGTEAFDKLRQKAELCAELDAQATAMDHQKLLGSALSALVNEHVDIGALLQQAAHFRQETDLALLAGALKRMQWATFTAARRAESADALWARNRDQHVKNMIRHWALQASASRAAKNQERAYDSPSLRPASRAAARSAEKQILPSSPPTAAATPGYMRTPSRSRRAPRFKPLPTPAHITPFNFDQRYLSTTPAPLANVRPEADYEAADASDVFEGLTPQITPFARKLRASGITPARVPQSALKSSVFGRSTAGGTNKSVRFAGAGRFGAGKARPGPADEGL